MKYYAWILITGITLVSTSCDETPTDTWAVAGVYLRTLRGEYDRGDTIGALILNRFNGAVDIKALNCEDKISIGLQVFSDSGFLPELPLPSDDCLNSFPSSIVPGGQMVIAFPIPDSGIMPGRYAIYIEYTSEMREYREDYVCSNPFFIRE
jgi:hypothetical protein